jgi:DNA-binding IclR family transcriptional regulator
MTEIDDQTDMADRYRAPALDKGLDILEILAVQPAGLTRAEIVKEMGRSPSEIYRMLERLVARKYVTRLNGDRYALTMKLFLLAHRHPPQRRMVAKAQPSMDLYANMTRQSCHLAIPERGRAIVLAQASPSDHWEFRVRIGAELDLFDTASGLTLLAFQHAGSRAETLATWSVAYDDARLAEVAERLEEIKKAGHYWGPSRQLVGVVDFSVPILGPSGDAVAVITCPYLEHPHDTVADGRAMALEKLKSLAGKLSMGG